MRASRCSSCLATSVAAALGLVATACHFPTTATKVGGPVPMDACTAVSRLGPTEPLRLNQFQCNVDGRSTLPCACGDFRVNNQSVYPLGVFNQRATTQEGSGIPVGGCNQSVFDGDIVLAWPDCATIAEVSGFVQGDPSEAVDGFFEGDDDLSLGLCPDEGSMNVIGRNGLFHPQEIREQGNFMDLENHTPNPFSGGMHIETQRCRFFRGVAQVGSVIADFEPRAGDTVSVAGDWVRDNFHSGYSEVHEGRIRATVHRPEVATDGGSATNLGAVSGFFANRSRQDTRLMLDIKIPRPPTGNWQLASCSFVTPVRTDPVCEGIPPQMGGLMMNPSNDTCTVTLDRPDGFETLFRKTIPDGLDCEDTCGGNNFQCSNVHFQQILLATWQPLSEAPYQDPGDTWLCSSCSCSDPAVAGATFVAPVQGCVTPGLDAASTADQAAACQQVCQGQICGNINGGCAIGACGPPATGANAQALFSAIGSCDANLPQQAVPVSPTGDFRGTLDAGAGRSHVTLQVGPLSTGPLSVSGEFFFNLTSDDGVTVIDFARMMAKVQDFDVGPKHVSELTVLSVQRLFGVFTSATDVQIPQSDGAWAVTGRTNGNRHPDSVVTNQGFGGTIDLAARTFHLHVAMTNPLDAAQSMEVDLVGTIDNVPPIADAGPSPRTAECGGVLVLDGSASSDPDPGDSITHFQWFNGAQGIGNQAQVTVRAPTLGASTAYTLHVYDQKLGSSETSVTVTATDTRGPIFNFVPPTITISQCTNQASIGQATAVDACGGAVAITSDAPTRFPLGTTVVTWTARDARGNTTTAIQTVVVMVGDDPSCCPTGSRVILGTSGNDNLVGTRGVDCILGRGGQDNISGLGGDDFISGGEGDDVIDGGGGNDRVFGGNGQDNLRGGSGNDLVVGGGGDDQCRGGDNDDIIRGGDGQDRLFGENGNDQLLGEAGDDRLDGGSGNDALDGGGLHDMCIGGPGTDTFGICEIEQQ